MFVDEAQKGGDTFLSFVPQWGFSVEVTVPAGLKAGDAYVLEIVRSGDSGVATTRAGPRRSKVYAYA
jgi:hypothetical protein